MTPNKAEASEASGIAIVDEATLSLAGAALLRKWRAQAVLITRGAEGMSLFRPGRRVMHMPTEPRDIFEVTGAGDTVVAACALALVCGASFEDAAVIANVAAGFVGEEVGTVAVPLQNLSKASRKIMKSMTGYGEASQNIRSGKVTVQIRSLNHRHLDLQLRVPREYMALEEEIRKTIRAKISRGRVDVFINRYAAKGQGRRLEMDEALVGQYIVGMKQLKKKFALAGEIDIALLADIPELIHVREVEIDGASERKVVVKALSMAIDKLEQARIREGVNLRTDMEEQITHLKRIVGDLESRAGENGTRLIKAPSQQDGSAALNRESSGDLGNLALKSDVNEELVRLKAHVNVLGKIIREREPVGKKIDFMLQEVNRELNTISSKVPNLPVVQLVLQGKERVEKIREQTQNIE